MYYCIYNHIYILIYVYLYMFYTHTQYTYICVVFIVFIPIPTVFSVFPRQVKPACRVRAVAMASQGRSCPLRRDHGDCEHGTRLGHDLLDLTSAYYIWKTSGFPFFFFRNLKEFLFCFLRKYGRYWYSWYHRHQSDYSLSTLSAINTVIVSDFFHLQGIAFLKTSTQIHEMMESGRWFSTLRDCSFFRVHVGFPGCMYIILVDISMVDIVFLGRYCLTTINHELTLGLVYFTIRKRQILGSVFHWDHWIFHIKTC